MKLSKTQQDLENIIKIFSYHPEGLTTSEVHEIFEDKYKTTRTQKTIKNRLDDLAAGMVDHIECQIRHRGKHTLINNRPKILSEQEKEQKLVRNKEQLVAEEHAYIRLALEAIKKLVNLSEKHHKIIEKRFNLDKIVTPYFIEKDQHEKIDIYNRDIIELKKAIEKDYLTEFMYEGRTRHGIYIVEPYKLIIFDGVWYLFGKDTEEKERSPYKTWRLKHIKDVEYDTHTKHTMDDDLLEDTLATALEPDFTIKEIKNGDEITLSIIRDTKVVIKVHPEAIEDFDHHAHLPGNTEDPIEMEDGSLLLTTTVSSYEDLEKEVKQWLPHIEIIEPLSYRRRLYEELKAAMRLLG